MLRIGLNADFPRIQRLNRLQIHTPALSKRQDYSIQSQGHQHMLNYAITFLIIALIAGVLGFTGIAGSAVGIAKILFLVFIVLFVISFLLGRRGNL